MKEKLEIRNIQIKKIFADELHEDMENVRHQKICRELSIVQALEGSYDFAIGKSKLNSTGEKGVFIAPSNELQTIIHHNGESGIMRAHWVFMDVIVDERYRFDELFKFPMILDKRYNEEVFLCITTIKNSKNYFKRIHAVYDLLEILAKEGWAKEKSIPLKTEIEEYVHSRYDENVKIKDIAGHLNYSQAQVYKLFKKYFALTPANYVNCVRLQKAEELLSSSKYTVTEIAFQVGFQDGAYFSRLFKKHYGVSPKEYRKRMLEKL